ncbi:hypothetical protein [Acaryochloris sp. CCMEE 5410]|uniref:hypothetical protein n=1 Tax=Acaryochloris sp. CCMEE 5410 TaxID=310037 RepID=UPI001F18639F|nr:hypothetical protein [Acaryochloris sp. CCMEE 5410]
MPSLWGPVHDLLQVSLIGFVGVGSDFTGSQEFFDSHPPEISQWGCCGLGSGPGGIDGGGGLVCQYDEFYFGDSHWRRLLRLRWGDVWGD